jgi:hypothetical protein
MSQPIHLDSIDQVLLDRSIKTGIKYGFEEIETLAAPIIDLVGISDVEKGYLAALSRKIGDYPIDASDMLKKLGIVSQGVKSKDIGRTLIRATIIPKLDLKKLDQEAWGPAGLHGQPSKSDQKWITLFENFNCRVISIGEIKHGREYRSIKYKLTISASHKVLMRAYNDDKFADYFSIQLQLIQKYKKYQSDYESHLKDVKLRQKDDKIDTLTTKLDKLLEFAEKASDDRQELKDELADVKIELSSSKKCINTIADHLTKKSRSSTKDPNYNGYHHHALVSIKHGTIDTEYKFTSGQSDYVDKVESELTDLGYQIHKSKFYNANGIDYRRNVESEMNLLIEKRLAPINEPILAKRNQLKQEIEETNAMLLEDIPVWNAELAERVRIHNLTADKKVRLSSNGRRYYHGKTTFEYLRRYENECRSYEREVAKSAFKLKTIPVKVGSTFIRWKPNKFVSLQDIDSIIDDVVKSTQKSPYQSLDESDSDSGMPDLLSDDDGY